MELRLFEKLKEAYGASSKKFNRFKDALEAIKWDYTFEADGEIYFIKGKLTVTVENLDPFKEKWRPHAIFEDGSVFAF